MRLVSYWRENRETPYATIILTHAKIMATEGFIIVTKLFYILYSF